MLDIRLLSKLREEKQKLEHLVTKSNVKDFAQYKYLVGQIAGFEAAIDICKNLFNGELNDLP